MNIQTYEEKYDIIQKLLNSHVSLGRSFWFNFMKDELQCCLTYEQILDQLKNDRAFKYDWSFGKFIQKVKNEVVLFEDFSYKEVFVPLKDDINSTRWVVAS